ELVVQGLNGTLNDTDRQALGKQIELLKARLVEIGNSKLGDRYLFGGTESSVQPFVEGDTHVAYQGDRSARTVSIGVGVAVPVNVAGDEVFGRFDPQGATFAGVTGAATGTTADEGAG